MNKKSQDSIFHISCPHCGEALLAHCDGSELVLEVRYEVERPTSAKANKPKKATKG